MIGKVDEILGPINQVYFTIKPSEGIQATSFEKGAKVYIAGDKLLPIERFLPKPKPPPGTKGDYIVVIRLGYELTRLYVQSRSVGEDGEAREVQAEARRAGVGHLEEEE